jgi:hypothetical protein
MRFRGLIVMVLGFLISSPEVQAQSPRGGMDGGRADGDMRGGIGGRGGMMGRPPGPRMDFPTAEQVEGPLTPSAMSQLLDLESDGTRRYADSYARHMQETAPVRDSLRTILNALRDARERGDREAMRSAMREHRDVVSRLWKDLSKRDEQFYKTVKKSLTKEQRKRFEQWQEDEEQAREAERPGGPAGPRRGRRPRGPPRGGPTTGCAGRSPRRSRRCPSGRGRSGTPPAPGAARSAAAGRAGGAAPGPAARAPPDRGCVPGTWRGEGPARWRRAARGTHGRARRVGAGRRAARWSRRPP